MVQIDEEALTATLVRMNELFGNGKITEVKFTDETKTKGIAVKVNNYSSPFEVTGSFNVSYLGRNWHIFEKVVLTKEVRGHLESTASFCSVCKEAGSLLTKDNVLYANFGVAHHIRELFNVG